MDVFVVVHVELKSSRYVFHSDVTLESTAGTANLVDVQQLVAVVNTPYRESVRRRVALSVAHERCGATSWVRYAADLI